VGSRAWLRLVVTAIRSRTASPRVLAVRSLSAMLVSVAEATGFALLVDRFGTLAGWSAPEIVLMYALGVTGQGLAQTVCNTLEPSNFTPLVREGAFDQILVRPAPALGWLLATAIDPRYLGRSVAGVGLLVWSAERAAVAWTPAALGIATLAACCCAALIVAIFAIGAGVSLRTVESSEIVHAFTFGGIYLTSFPMEIYSSVLRLLFTWVLPFALAVYIPALALLGRAGPPGLSPALLAATPAATIAVCAVAWLCWRVGVRRYLGTGS
jgi:ABC-2 type transport system permease protein